jgi:hypothetical protein
LSEEELNQLEKSVNSLKEKKIRAEEQLKNLRSQKDAVVAELAVLGVTPKDLDNVINTLEAKINTQLAAINAQIPENIT